MKVGLVGFACATGLGAAALDFYRNLPFDRFLVIPHYGLGVDDSALDARCRVCPTDASEGDIVPWLRGLDAIFSIEHSYLRGLWRIAAAAGVKVFLMPNVEWLDAGNPELRLVDGFIAPTRASSRLLGRLGYRSRTVYVPHPVDCARYAFRERSRAEVFLHCRGWGGYAGRKGTSVVLAAARACPEIPFLVRTQALLAVETPPNVVVTGGCRNSEELYEDGDVAIQPSRWEGVGLQILEAMACGMPVIVPDAPPMNEYPADRALCVKARRGTAMLEGRPWRSAEVDPVRLAGVVRELHGREISDLSRRARAAMERRSWPRIRPRLMAALGMA